MHIKNERAQLISFTGDTFGGPKEIQGCSTEKYLDFNVLTLSKICFSACFLSF